MNRLTAAGICALLCGILLSGGCGSGGSSRPDTFRGLDRAARYAAGGSTRYLGPAAGVAAFSVDRTPIEWSVIAGRLAEAAGAVVVEEIALELVLDREARRQGVAITRADLDREREWLAHAVSRSARLAPSTDTAALVAEVRQRRGLGPERFAALLRRNAQLRAMVRDSIEITPEQVELAWRVQHGERVRVRLIVVSTMQDAQTLRTQALAAGNEMAFAKLAETYSTDNSAPLGGLIEPFSTDDPAYENSIRRVAAGLQPGEIGPVVSTRNGHAVVYLTERLPPDGVSLEEAREELGKQIAQRQERIRMDQLATRLLAEARVRVTDPALAWSVEAGRGR
ncbi:MAG: peptidyl-prolyl cis-trans isomerase [Planctomycetota bacterium]|nr:peptidyl-prolyl cis-trans isomerase [Planctomycetota bacterium]